jgi:MinD superfamily P-loop ATPase
MAHIDAENCIGCGKCMSHCRFGAIEKIEKNDKTLYQVEEISCEGCGVCSIVCPEDAVTFETSNNGQWFISETKFGPMSHARLGVAEACKSCEK